MIVERGVLSSQVISTLIMILPASFVIIMVLVKIVFEIYVLARQAPGLRVVKSEGIVLRQYVPAALALIVAHPFKFLSDLTQSMICVAYLLASADCLEYTF